MESIYFIVFSSVFRTDHKLFVENKQGMEFSLSSIIQPVLFPRQRHIATNNCHTFIKSDRKTSIACFNIAGHEKWSLSY